MVGKINSLELSYTFTFFSKSIFVPSVVDNSSEYSIIGAVVSTIVMMTGYSFS